MEKLFILAIFAIVCFMAYYTMGHLGKRNDVKVFSKKYKIKLRYEDEINYYTLCVYSPLFGFLPYYKTAGEYFTDEVWGFSYFIEYKFNSVLESERFYDNKFQK